MEKINTKWIADGLTPEAVSWAEGFGKELAEDEKGGPKALTTSQLRKFFGEVKRIEAGGEVDKAELIMLKPLLAYAVGRDAKKTKIADFAEQVTRALDAVIQAENEEKRKSCFHNFVKLFEAIVAYHKYYGGK